LIFLVLSHIRWQSLRVDFSLPQCFGHLLFARAPVDFSPGVRLRLLFRPTSCCFPVRDSCRSGDLVPAVRTSAERAGPIPSLLGYPVACTAPNRVFPFTSTEAGARRPDLISPLFLRSSILKFPIESCLSYRTKKLEVLSLNCSLDVVF
jgi:hypothetical protein